MEQASEIKLKEEEIQVENGAAAKFASSSLPHVDFIEGSPIPMVAVKGPKHIVCQSNPAFHCLCGKTAELLAGKLFSEVVPESDRNGCAALLAEVYRTGVSASISDQEHLQSLTPPAYWSYSMWAILAPDGLPVGVMMQITDTTESLPERLRNARMNQEMIEMNQELVIAAVREHELAEAAAHSRTLLFQAQKMEGIGRLAGGIAHDFNNLLTAIMGFTELAEETLEPDNSVQEYLRNIQKAAERAAMLTSQLLAFARKQIVEPKIVSINALMLEIDPLLRRLIGERIELVLLLPPESGYVKIDSGQFGQVVINLVVNARDAMPHGGKITLETANASLSEGRSTKQDKFTDDDCVLLKVSDTGTGIEAEAFELVFEPFYTTKAQGKGTGLGLSTCYGIVKQSGGEIKVESFRGNGSIFKVFLPRHEEPPTSILVEKPSLLQPTNGTILFVEDEPMLREIGAQMLRRQGYLVIEAENGVDALRKLEEHSGEIQLLVTDVVMPKMGGRELSDRLFKMRPNLKTLFTSGHTDDIVIQQGSFEPGTTFLQKPFLFATLVQKVRDSLDDK